MALMIELAKERCKLIMLYEVADCKRVHLLRRFRKHKIISLHASSIVRGTEIGSHWVNCNFFPPAKTFSIYIELLANQLIRCVVIYLITQLQKNTRCFT